MPILELRDGPPEILERAYEDNQPVLIQRNGEPVAVLISVDRYEQFINRKME